MINRFALSFLCIELDRNVRFGVTLLYILLLHSIVISKCNRFLTADSGHGCTLVSEQERWSRYNAISWLFGKETQCNKKLRSSVTSRRSAHSNRHVQLEANFIFW